MKSSPGLAHHGAAYKAGDVRQKDFRTDENQNDGQRGFEVDEAVDGGSQEKIERPQAENGKDVAGVNDE